MSGYRSGGSAGRILLKTGTDGQTSLGTANPSTTVTTTAGSYDQVIASTSAEYLIIGLAFFSYGFNTVLVADFPLKIELATGGAGSEVVKATTYASQYSAVSTTYALTDRAHLLVPLRVQSGTRLAVRASKSGAVQNASFTLRVDVLAVPYVNLEGN